MTPHGQTPPTAYVTRREALAWAAGFIDGEGCFHLAKVKRRGREYRRPIFTTNQGGDETGAPPDVILRMYSIIGLGFITAQDRTKWNDRYPLWYHRVSGFEQVQAVLAMVWPWLGDRKREQAKRVLRGYLTWSPRGIGQEVLIP